MELRITRSRSIAISGVHSDLPSIQSSKVFAAMRPIFFLPAGRTVVRPGRKKPVMLISSKPMIETSSGTRLLDSW